MRKGFGKSNAVMRLPAIAVGPVIGFIWQLPSYVLSFFDAIFARGFAWVVGATQEGWRLRYAWGAIIIFASIAAGLYAPAQVPVRSAVQHRERNQFVREQGDPRRERRTRAGARGCKAEHCTVSELTHHIASSVVDIMHRAIIAAPTGTPPATPAAGSLRFPYLEMSGSGFDLSALGGPK